MRAAAVTPRLADRRHGGDRAGMLRTGRGRGTPIRHLTALCCWVKVAECRWPCYAAPLVLGAGRCGLACQATEDGPVGLAGCGPASAAAAHFGNRSMTDSKAVTTGGCPLRAAIARAVLFDGGGPYETKPAGCTAAPESSPNSSRSPAWAARSTSCTVQMGGYRFCLMFRLSWPEDGRGASTRRRPALALSMRQRGEAPLVG